MTARVIIPTAAGDQVSYDLVMHGSSGLRIVFQTSDESFERWLFYMLRELGAHISTDDPEAVRQRLGLSPSEAGIVDANQVEVPLLNRNPATPA